MLGDLIAGFAVLAGFLFALVIFVFQLRLNVVRDPRVQSKRNLPELIDQLFRNVLYAVVVSFVLTIVAIVAAATEPAPGVGVHPVWSGVVTVVTVHLLAVVWMCVSRTRTAYLELSK